MIDSRDIRETNDQIKAEGTSIVMSKLKGREPATVEMGKAKGLIFGASGVGKTWFSLGFPAPYYIDTEGGANGKHYQEILKKSGGAYMGQEDGTLDFMTIIDQMKALATEQHPYKTLVVDSITKLFQTAISNESERIIESGNKDEFGASKKSPIRMMRRIVNWMSKLDMNIWLIAHETSEWGIVNGQRSEIGKCADIWDKLPYEVNLALRVLRRGKTYPATAIVTKTRLTGFPEGEVFPFEYGEFSTRYGKDYIEAVVKPITLAEESQVDEIKRLIDVMKVSPEEIEKILTKASASEWKELNKDQAAKTIEFFNKKLNPGKVEKK